VPYRAPIPILPGKPFLKNNGYALLIDFKKFFDNIRHDILFALLDKHISDERVKHLVRSFVSVFGPGKSLGLGSQVSQIAAVFFPDKVDHFIKDKKMYQILWTLHGRPLFDTYGQSIS
jgi:retron-type reverse transcriptase